MLDPIELLHQRRSEILSALGDEPADTFENEALLELLWSYDRAIMNLYFTFNQTPMSDTAVKKNEAIAQFDPIREHFVKTLGEEAFAREVSFAIQLINNNSQLQRSTLASRLVAVANVANIGLSLNPVLKEAYLVPRNVKVKTETGDRWEVRCFLEPSYIGMIKLATDSGSVRSMHADLVWEGDDIEIVQGTVQHIKHVPFLQTGRPKGNLKGAYSVAKLTDGSFNVLVMDIDELRKVKAASEAVKKGNASPYDDWENEMFRKAPIRRHFKMLPKSDRYEILAKAIAMDEEEFGSVDNQLLEASDQERELLTLRRRIIDALELYQGEDKDAIAGQCAAKVAAGEFTVEFANNILAQIGEKAL